MDLMHGWISKDPPSPLLREGEVVLRTEKDFFLFKEKKKSFLKKFWERFFFLLDFSKETFKSFSDQRKILTYLLREKNLYLKRKINLSLEESFCFLFEEKTKSFSEIILWLFSIVLMSNQASKAVMVICSARGKMV